MGNRFKGICIVVLICLLLYSATKLAPKFPVGKEPQSHDAEAKEGVRVAFSVGGNSNPWSTDLIDDLSQACAAQNLELIYHEPADATPEWQLNDIQNIIDTEQIQYLVLFPAVDTMIQEVTTLAEAHQVQVILISSELNLSDACATTIYINAYSEGQLCAKALIDQYGTSKDCNIIEIYGPEESHIASARDQGFRDAIAGCPNFRIMKTCYGGFDQLTAKNAMEELIGANPRGTFNAVFACSDQDGLGALQALKIAGYSPGVDVSLVSINGIQDTKKAIIAGEYTATVESGRHLGYVAISIITRLISGEAVSHLFVMPYRLCDAENVSAYEPTLY